MSAVVELATTSSDARLVVEPKTFPRKEPRTFLGDASKSEDEEI
jgi:hypothetical protein